MTMTRLRHVALIVPLLVTLTYSQQPTSFQQQQQQTRPRRQFAGSEWVPLSQPCPTCRPFADPADSRANFDDIGLVPPRPPPSQRQVQGTGNFFPQTQEFQQNVFSQQRPSFSDFTFSQFNQQQSNPFAPQEPFFTQQQQQSFLPQTYLNNQQLLLNENPQLIPLVNNPQLLLSQQKPPEAQAQLLPSKDQIRFRPEGQNFDFKTPQQHKNRPTNAPVTRLELPLNSPPSSFHNGQPQFPQQPSTFPPKQQTFPQQQQTFPQQQQSLPQKQQTFPQKQQIFPQQQQTFPQQQQTFPQQQKSPQQQQHPFPKQLQPFPKQQQPLPQQLQPFQQQQQPFQQQQQPLTQPQQPFQQQTFQQLTPFPQTQLQFQPGFPEFAQAQSHLQVNPRDPFLSTPPVLPAQNNSDFVIPGLDKEEIQLLYVPVETLRQRGQLQGHTLEEPRPNFQNEFQQIQQTPAGHFITQPPSSSSSLTPRPSESEDSHKLSTTADNPSSTQTTEKVVTIQPRPVSTIGQQESFKTSAPAAVSTQTKRPYPSISTANEIFGNEVTSSFPSRFTKKPTIESATEITIPSTTLQPHQPPLSIFARAQQHDVRDILQALKESEYVTVIDNIAGETPKVFVGPANLNSPPGYAKSELPYLSNLEPQRIEQRDNLPFFVAPLNFNSPQGYAKISFPPPHVGAVVYVNDEESDLEKPELFQSLDDTTTTTTSTVRPSRGRRPSQYRQATRKPASGSRQRGTPTPRPQEEQTTRETSEQPQQYLRESQTERKRLSPRRQRVKSTTEAVTEAAAHSEVYHETIQPQAPPAQLKAQLVELDATEIPQPTLQSPVYPAVDFKQEERPVIKQTLYPHDDFVPPPPPSAFGDDRKQSVQYHNQPSLLPQVPFAQSPFEMFHPTPQEIQEMFPSTPDQPLRQSFASSERPSHHLSSIDYDEDERKPTQTTYRDESATQTDSEQIEKDVEQVDITKNNRYVPVVNSDQVSPGVRSHPRLRPRGSTTTTAEPEEKGEEVQDDSGNAGVEEVTSTTEATKPTSKYLSHFNRPRKPQRGLLPKTETTTTSPPNKSYTVRPLRRLTTIRTTLSTKRMRKPTTPLPFSEDIVDDEQLSNDNKFVPSATGNDIYDERPVAPLKPKLRKPYIPRKKSTEDTTTTSPTLSTKTYQERHDENASEDEVYRSGVSEVDTPVTALSPEENEGIDLKSHTKEDQKKVYDYEQKKGRRRLRVKVQKRPQDNFETAESQNHGSVSNLLITSPQKPTAPDLYQFGKGEFDFENSERFIATYRKDYARNITADILENTDSFSSPGSDTTVQQVTIVSEPTTILPEISSTSVAALVSNDSFETEKITTLTAFSQGKFESTTTEEPTTLSPARKDSTRFQPQQEVTEAPTETTTLINDEVAAATIEFNYSPTTIVTTTPSVTTTTPTGETVTPPPSSTTSTTTTTTPSSTTTSKTASYSPVHPRQRKVLRTSTTTQVSHETEICYKGKCVKTNSENPDKALKRLVEEANSEEATKVIT